MFNVTCEINEAKKNSTNKIQIASVDNQKIGYGFVEIKLGNESIIVDGYEVTSAINNCTNNEGKLHRRRSPYTRNYVTTDRDDEEEN